MKNACNPYPTSTLQPHQTPVKPLSGPLSLSFPDFAHAVLTVWTLFIPLHPLCTLFHPIPEVTTSWKPSMISHRLPQQPALPITALVSCPHSLDSEGGGYSTFLTTVSSAWLSAPTQ